MIPYLPYMSIASSRAAASRVGGRAIRLREMFLRKQHELLASLSAGELMDHPTSTGTATERHWIDFLNAHLPQRYGASSAFIIDADGRRSRQIDVAVYDRLYTPPFFAQPSGLHLPAESVYAVFEIKQVLGPGVIVDAARKAASVRALRRTSAPIPSASGTLEPKPPPPILAGILAQRSGWASCVRDRLAAGMETLSAGEMLDLGCALRDCAFELLPPNPSARRKQSLVDRIHLSRADESLIFFVIRLLDRLRALGTAPAPDLSAYTRTLESFAKKR